MSENLPVNLEEQVSGALALYHKTYPLRHGMPREELRRQLNLSHLQFNLLLKNLKAAHVLVTKGKWLALPSHRVWFSPFELVKVNRLLDKFAAAPFSPPSVKDARNEVGRELYFRMLACGHLLAVSDEVLFRASDYETMQVKVCELIAKNGRVTAAEVRDLLGTSRKYALALLEYLDKIGVTMRDADCHRLNK